MRKYFTLAKEFPIQMAFIFLGVIITFLGLVFTSIDKNPSVLFILLGIILIILPAKNMRKRQMRQLRNCKRQDLEQYFERSDIWQGLPN